MKGNTVRKNNQSQDINSAGIIVSTDCQVKDNILNENGQNNIRVINNGNVIEENLVLNSNNGINFDSGGNFYSNNRASKCTTNYANTHGNTDGGGNASF